MSRPKLTPHVFTPDPDVPADHLGRGACTTCHLIGRRGDARHTMPDTPLDDAQSRAAGERSDR